MSDHCHHHEITFTGNDPVFRQALILVIMINAGMFFLEIGAGHWASSQALLADALDFFADALTYGLSLAVIGMSLAVRTRAARIKAFSLVLMGAYVLLSTVYQVFILAVPEAFVMGSVAIAALTANILSVALLYRWRDGDANIRSVWLCSRNDALGNIAVFAAALGVFGTGTAWPDLIVATIMAGLFLQSSMRIFRQARREMAHGIDADDHPHHHDHGAGH